MQHAFYARHVSFDMKNGNSITPALENVYTNFVFFDLIVFQL